MTDVMLAETPVESREQILRDSCDQIVERCYTRKFDQTKLNERRSELADVSIQLKELDDQLSEVKAGFKARIKPLLERKGKILDELKAGGEWIKGDVFKFVDFDEGKTAFYSPEGYKLEERPITPEERQRNVFQVARKTGTND